MPLAPLARNLGKLVAAALSAAVLAAAFPAPATAQQAGRAAKYFEDALVRYERKDVAGAIIQLRNALKADPNHLAAIVLLGKAQLGTGEAIAAEESFAKALRLGIDRSEVAVPMAQALLDQGKFAAVLERFPPESAAPASRADLLVLRGQAHKGLGDVRSALASFDAARAADPRSIPAILHAADLQLRNGNAGEAENLIAAGLAFAPDDAGLLTTQGTLAIVRGNAEQALAAYGRALEANPAYFMARSARASLLVDLGRLDAASGDVTRLGTERPTDPRVNRLRAAYLAARGDEAAARDVLREVVGAIDTASRDELKRRDPELLFLAGVVHAELRDRQKARLYLEEFLKVEPRNVAARKVLGSILIAQADPLAALSVLEEARRLSPGDPEVLALLAGAYSSRRQYQSATALLEDALKLSGGAPAMYVQMGIGLLYQGRVDLGVEQLERGLAKDPAQAYGAMLLAVTYLQRGNARKAVEVAERLVKAEPKNVAAHNLLGLCRASARDPGGARAAYERAIQLDGTFTGAKLNLARLDVAEGRYDAARDRLNSVLKERPRDVQAMFELANAEDAAGRSAEAVRWLEKARDLRKRNDDVAVRLVGLYLRTNAADKALEVAKDAEARAPDSPAVLGALARAQLALGDAKSAQAVLSRMSRLAGGDPDVLVQVAQLQLLANDTRGAASSVDKALAARPNFLPAMVLLALIDIRGGEFARAEQRAKSIVAGYPASPLGHRLLADAALAQKSYALAVASYREALKKEPSTETALMLFRAYMQGGMGAKGVEFMQGWVKERPNDAAAVRALADGQHAIGNLAAARAGYETVLKLGHADPILLNNLANVLARQGDSAALEYAERAHRLAPTDPSVQDTLGWILVGEGRLQEGLRHLREARLRSPQDPEIRFHLAAALVRAGRKEEARQELEPALKAGVPFNSVADARKLAAELGAR